MESDRKRFKRNYSACLNCRTRKVRCDLGNVDSPNEPPCLRCKRERKECVFVESKRGRQKSNQSSIQKQTTRHKQPSSLQQAELSQNQHGLPSMESTFSLLNSIPKETSKSFVSQSSNASPQASASYATAFANGKTNNSNINIDMNLTPSPPPDDSGSTCSNTRPVPNNNSTMIYLAHIAGKIAQPDDRDRIDAKQRITHLENTLPSRTHSPTLNEPSSLSKRPSENEMEPIVDSFGHDSSIFPPGRDSNGRFTIPPPKSTLLIRPLAGTKLTDIEYIGPSIQQKNSHGSEYQPLNCQISFLLTENEAKRLIKLFFLTMHPFYPFIPKELHDPDVLPGYPMLLCALLAISARYHSLPDKIGEWDFINSNESNESALFENGADDVSNKDASAFYDSNQESRYSNGERHIAVHEQLWIYCQRLMSMTVWGESSSRSIGTLLAFLMFTEWNPRAIHFRWSDYANDADDDSLASLKRNNKPPEPNTRGLGQQPDIGITGGDGASEAEYAGISALKRSEMMSFMLIGTATRLSFLLDDHPLIFIATHVSETHAAINLHKKSMLQQTLSEVDVNDSRFHFSQHERATLELLQFLSLSYETLYGTKPKFISLDNYQTLSVLDILSPVLENWYRKYYKLLKPSSLHYVGLTSSSKSSLDSPIESSNNKNINVPNWLELLKKYPKLSKDLYSSMERESLILDYYYTKLYLYSLALSGDTSVTSNLKNSKKGKSLRLDELARYSRYVELAYKAAKEVLNVIFRVKKLRLLIYMPVRWVTRVIKSVSFIVKCYLTLTTDFQGGVNKSNNANDEILKLSVIPVEEIIILLQKTAICLRDSAPDELHLCTRYSTILMYLCSQFKTQMKDHKKSNVREYEKDMQESEATQRINEESVTAHQPAEAVEFMNVGIGGMETGNMVNVEAVGTVNAGSNNEANSLPENFDFNNANQELFDDLFKENPSETLFNWFSTNDNNPGLDFVDQFTKEIERDLFSKKQFN